MTYGSRAVALNVHLDGDKRPDKWRDQVPTVPFTLGEHATRIAAAVLRDINTVAPRYAQDGTPYPAQWLLEDVIQRLKQNV